MSLLQRVIGLTRADGWRSSVTWKESEESQRSCTLKAGGLGNLVKMPVKHPPGEVSGHVPSERGLRADPGLTGEMITLGCLGNTSVSPW